METVQDRYLKLKNLKEPNRRQEYVVIVSLVERKRVTKEEKGKLHKSTTWASDG